MIARFLSLNISKKTPKKSKKRCRKFDNIGWNWWDERKIYKQICKSLNWYFSGGRHLGRRTEKLSSLISTVILSKISHYEANSEMGITNSQTLKLNGKLAIIIQWYFLKIKGWRNLKKRKFRPHILQHFGWFHTLCINIFLRQNQTNPICPCRRSPWNITKRNRKKLSVKKWGEEKVNTGGSSNWPHTFRKETKGNSPQTYINGSFTYINNACTKTK